LEVAQAVLRRFILFRVGFARGFAVVGAKDRATRTTRMFSLSMISFLPNLLEFDQTAILIFGINPIIEPNYVVKVLTLKNINI